MPVRQPVLGLACGRSPACVHGRSPVSLAPPPARLTTQHAASCAFIHLSSPVPWSRAEDRCWSVLTAASHSGRLLLHVVQRSAASRLLPSTVQLQHLRVPVHCCSLSALLSALPYIAHPLGLLLLLLHLTLLLPPLSLSSPLLASTSPPPLLCSTSPLLAPCIVSCCTPSLRSLCLLRCCCATALLLRRSATPLLRCFAMSLRCVCVFISDACSKRRQCQRRDSSPCLQDGERGR